MLPAWMGSGSSWEPETAAALGWQFRIPGDEGIESGALLLGMGPELAPSGHRRWIAD